MDIVIADDEPKVRFALKVLLQRRPNVNRIAEVSDAEQLQEYMQHQQPDLALLDGEIPGFHPHRSLRELRAISPRTILIVLSGRPELRGQLLDQGADAFVSKVDSPKNLLSAIDQCCQEPSNSRTSE